MALPNGIDEVFVTEFEAFVLHAAQSQKTRLRTAVREKLNVTGSTAVFNKLDKSDMVPGVRHGDTPIADDAFTTATCTLLPWDKAFLIDNIDEVRTLISLSNPYTKNLLMALGRRYDLSILKAMQDASSPLTYSGTAGVGLTTAVLMDIVAQISDREWDEEDRYIGITGHSIATLLQDGKASNSDYDFFKRLNAGSVENNEMWCGFKFRKLLTADGTTDLGGNGRVVRTLSGTATDTEVLYAWEKDAIGLAIGDDMTVRMDERPDKRHATQCAAYTDHGAVTIDEERLVEITVDYIA
jgi:hypothetical protein